MTLNIKNLLNKKGWTGEEAGRALMASLVYDLEHHGKADKPLFSQAELERMENSLNETEFTTYGVYRDVYSATVDFYNRSEAYKQQFYNGYYRYLMHLNECMQADHELAKAECFPLILTQEQYNGYKEQCLKSYEEWKYSFKEIVFDFLDFYLENPDQAPKAIVEALEAIKKQPATNKRILENYNEDTGAGYYILPDGRRSDKMSREEWQKALEQDFLATHKLTINGEPASPEETAKSYNVSRLLHSYKLLFGGVEAIKEEMKKAGLPPIDEKDEGELEEALKDLLNGTKRAKVVDGLKEALNYGTNAKWVDITEQPSNLTKYEVLALIGSERYSGICADRLLNGEYVDEISEKDAFKEFMKDYPELYKALKEEAESYIASLKGLKPAQYTKKFVLKSELAAIDMPIDIYRQEASEMGLNMDIAEAYAAEHSELDAYAIRMRTAKSGIAIIQGKGGFFNEKESPYKLLLESRGLEAKANNENEAEEIRQVAANLIKPAMRYLYSYNTLIDILSRVYAFDGEKALQIDLESFESKIDAFNNLLYIFYVDIYGDDKEQKRKQKIIKELFSPIDIEGLKPTQQSIVAMEARIKKLGTTQSARECYKGGGFEKLIVELAGEGANIL